MPSVAPATSLKPKADSTMWRNTAGTSPMLMTMTTRPTARYASAMKGTTTCVMLAMRFTPPMMMRPETNATARPMMALNVVESWLKEVAKDSEIALVWNAS